MLKLDHLTVIAPSLAEGVLHVQECLDIDVPFGQRHLFMGTHNHLLRLGGSVYLEIVALDPDGADPGRARWFGLDNRTALRADCDNGRRLRGWVASTDDIGAVIAAHGDIFGDKVALPKGNPAFDFSIPTDGSLPLDGAAPSLIDRRGKARSMDSIADLGARLNGFTLDHPTPDILEALYQELAIDRPPVIRKGQEIRYQAHIDTAAGPKILT